MDLTHAAMTAAELEQKLADAVFVMTHTQTPERRAYWLAQIDALRAEAKRRQQQANAAQD